MNRWKVWAGLVCTKRGRRAAHGSSKQCPLFTHSETGVLLTQLLSSVSPPYTGQPSASCTNVGHCVTSRSLVFLRWALSSLAICDVSKRSQPRSRLIYLSPWSAPQHHRGVGSVGCKVCWKHSASVSHAVILQDSNTCAGPERRSLSWSMRWRHAQYSYS